MGGKYKVVLTTRLIGVVEALEEPDHDIVLGFVEALRMQGLDVILGRGVAPDPGFSVEYTEPGETPGMVWVRVFLDLTRRSLPLVVRCVGTTLRLED